jgi:hypothetical protein
MVLTTLLGSVEKLKTKSEGPFGSHGARNGSENMF